MSLKQEIETWVAALAAYDANEFDNSLQCFSQIADTSKIFFNLGVINATLGEHVKAVEYYQHAVQLDQYLAVAYFQQGVSNFLMGDFEEALANFNDTLLYLRGNNNIDYQQLGLKFQLHSCEVLFNRGLCYIYLQQKEAGMQDLMFAAKEKRVPDHDVIDEAIREQAEGYTVFSIPVGVVYRPNEAKVKNLRAKDYLGKARLVAQQERQNTARAREALAAISIDDRPDHKLSYGALNLVKPDLRSRSRQQSEPPMHRNIFPPTPPPEAEHAELLQRRQRRISSDSSASQSSRTLANKPMRLELGIAAFDQSSRNVQQQRQPQQHQHQNQHQHEPAHTSAPVPHPRRAESERPAARRRLSDREMWRVQQSRLQQENIRQQISSAPEVRIEEDPIKPYDSNNRSATTPTGSIHQHNKSTSTSTRRSQPTISEEGENDYGEGATASGTDSPSSSTNPPLAFEIIPPQQYQQRPTGTHSTPPRRHASQQTPSLSKIRIKIHGAEDMRYIMTTPTVQYVELAEQIRTKFGLQGSFKLKVKDEDGDLITVGDEDDWEMAVAGVRAGLEKEGAAQSMGKLEMWVQES